MFLLCVYVYLHSISQLGEFYDDLRQDWCVPDGMMQVWFSSVMIICLFTKTLPMYAFVLCVLCVCVSTWYCNVPTRVSSTCRNVFNYIFIVY
jgi:hypothetical protein